MGQCYRCQLHQSELETKMVIHQEERESVQRLLMLGSGSSGKSTIYKQLQLIFGEGLEKEQIDKARDAIRQNMYDGIVKLRMQSVRIDEQIRLSMDVDKDPKMIADADEICASNSGHIFLGDNMSMESMVALGNAIGTLWDLELTKHTLSKRGVGNLMFSFPDNMETFFVRAELIFVLGWDPSTEDVIRARVMTAGMKSNVFTIDGHKFDIIDVGGQRNERKKWIHIFHNVDAVLFVASLDHYRLVLVEQEQKNAMRESLELFNETINGKWFKRGTIVLFLSKEDLHRKAIKQGHSMNIAFGDTWDADREEKKSEFAMVDYVKMEDAEKDEESLARAVVSSIAFIKRLYLNQRVDESKEVFVHVCNALDRKSVEKVYTDAQNYVVDNYLKKNLF